MRQISPGERAAIEREMVGQFGPAARNYILEDRHRLHVGDVLRGSTVNPQVSQEKSPEKKGLTSLGKRVDRDSFGQHVGEINGSLLAKVYGLLSFSFAFTATGTVIGMSMEPGVSILLFLLQIGLIFAIVELREQEPLNLVLLYAFCFITGLMIGPLLAQYLRAGMGGVVVQAVGATAIVTAGMMALGLSVKRDLSPAYAYLFPALAGLVAVHLLGLAFGSDEGLLLLNWIGVVLFCAYIVADINRVRFVPNTMGNAILICLDLYLDIVNLLLNLLEILSELSGDD